MTSSEKEIFGKAPTDLDQPFGKNVQDAVALRRIQGVARHKFWLTSAAILALGGLLAFTTSDRVKRLSAVDLVLAPISKIQVVGDKIMIPPLIVALPKQVEQTPAWAKQPASPIQVLSFVNQKNIPPGAEAKAVLLTGATNGLIKARLIEPVKVDGLSLLDAGVLLLGQGHSTEERLYVKFTKAVFRDGKALPISAQAYEAGDSIVGLKGSRVGDIALKLAATSGLNFLAGMAAGLQEPAVYENGRPKRPSERDAALSGASKAASEQAQSMMEDIKNRPPIIEVKSGTVFIVTFDDGGN